MGTKALAGPCCRYLWNNVRMFEAKGRPVEVQGNASGSPLWALQSKTRTTITRWYQFLSPLKRARGQVGAPEELQPVSWAGMAALDLGVVEAGLPFARLVLLPDGYVLLDRSPSNADMVAQFDPALMSHTSPVTVPRPARSRGPGKHPPGMVHVAATTIKLWAVPIKKLKFAGRQLVGIIHLRERVQHL
jgi:hypothetical protein